MANPALDNIFGVRPEDLLPKVNYGQADGTAWNPSSRGDVYQQAEKARSDAAFANLFAADIIFSKQGTGSTAVGRDGKSVRFNNNGYLYNKNSLNAAQSWAGQAFGAPAVKGADGNWYTAYGQLNMTSRTVKTVSGGREGIRGTRTVYNGAPGDYGFVQGERITDQSLVRQLDSGTYAFTAQGSNGSTVYVPYASGYELQKGAGGKPEAGNYKRDAAQGATGRDARTAYNVRPNVVGDPLGLRQTLLGGGPPNRVIQKNKTLLG